jgi:hypothetical protein
VLVFTVTGRRPPVTVLGPPRSTGSQVAQVFNLCAFPILVAQVFNLCAFPILVAQVFNLCAFPILVAQVFNLCAFPIRHEPETAEWNHRLTQIWWLSQFRSASLGLIGPAQKHHWAEHLAMPCPA